MKKTTLMLIIVMSIISCSKGDDTNSTAEYFSITNNQIFEFDLGAFGDEDGARIITQAAHFEISELNGNGVITYTYKAQSGYVGTDFVSIETTKGSDGSSNSDVIEIVDIRFNIIE